MSSGEDSMALCQKELEFFEEFLKPNKPTVRSISISILMSFFLDSDRRHTVFTFLQPQLPQFLSVLENSKAPKETLKEILSLIAQLSLKWGDESYLLFEIRRQKASKMHGKDFVPSALKTPAKPLRSPKPNAPSPSPSRSPCGLNVEHGDPRNRRNPYYYNYPSPSPNQYHPNRTHHPPSSPWDGNHSNLYTDYNPPQNVYSEPLLYYTNASSDTESPPHSTGLNVENGVPPPRSSPGYYHPPALYPPASHNPPPSYHQPPSGGGLIGHVVQLFTGPNVQWTSFERFKAQLWASHAPFVRITYKKSGVLCGTLNHGGEVKVDNIFPQQVRELDDLLRPDYRVVRTDSYVKKWARLWV